jgi:hypothetical protein
LISAFAAASAVGLMAAFGRLANGEESGEIDPVAGSAKTSRNR